ncbi:MAG: hypothetical protein ABJO02_07910 [Reichenbachiella sp.]|uniref:hypothetical protein n=1 Tax=Reichenbachiella sp. TaxID=2184521 RepID=UPI003299C514
MLHITTLCEITVTQRQLKELMNLPSTTELIQCHSGTTNFNYDLVVDWAIELLENNIETEYILILASFSKPVDSRDITNYLDSALRELNLPILTGEDALNGQVRYRLTQVLNENKVRDQLTYLYNLTLESDYKKDLMPFYLVYHGWWEFEDLGANYYSKGQTVEQLQNELKEEALKWLNEHQRDELKFT